MLRVNGFKLELLYNRVVKSFLIKSEAGYNNKVILVNKDLIHLHISDDCPSIILGRNSSNEIYSVNTTDGLCILLWETSKFCLHSGLPNKEIQHIEQCFSKDKIFPNYKLEYFKISLNKNKWFFKRVPLNLNRKKILKLNKL